MHIPSTGRLVLLAASLLLSACGNDALRSAETLRQQAAQSLQEKNFGAAVEQAGAATRKAPDDYEAQFLLAQAQAQSGNRNAALVALEAAIRHGYKDDQAIAGNANLQPLHAMTAYQELMAASFPRAAQPAPAAVSISDSSGKTVIKAGDVSIEMPKD